MNKRISINTRPGFLSRFASTTAAVAVLTGGLILAPDAAFAADGLETLFGKWGDSAAAVWKALQPIITFGGLILGVVGVFQLISLNKQHQPTGPAWWMIIGGGTAAAMGVIFKYLVGTTSAGEGSEGIDKILGLQAPLRDRGVQAESVVVARIPTDVIVERRLERLPPSV